MNETFEFVSRAVMFIGTLAIITALGLGLFDFIRPTRPKQIDSWARPRSVLVTEETKSIITKRIQRLRLWRSSATLMAALVMVVADVELIFLPAALFVGYLVGTVAVEVLESRKATATVATLTARSVGTYVSRSWIIAAIAIAAVSVVVVGFSGASTVEAFTCRSPFPPHLLWAVDPASPNEFTYGPNTWGLSYLRSGVIASFTIMALVLSLVGANKIATRRQSASSAAEARVDNAFRGDAVRMTVGSGLAVCLGLLAIQVNDLSAGFNDVLSISNCAELFANNPASTPWNGIEIVLGFGAGAALIGAGLVWCYSYFKATPSSE